MSNLPVQPLEVTSFVGGITDYFIDGRPDQAEEMDNIFINPNGKPVERNGFFCNEFSQNSICLLFENFEKLLKVDSQRSRRSTAPDLRKLTRLEVKIILDFGLLVCYLLYVMHSF